MTDTDAVVPAIGSLYLEPFAYRNLENDSSASPLGSARICALSASRSALRRSTSRSGNEGEVRTSVMSSSPAVSLSRRRVMLTTVLSQSAPASSEDPSFSNPSSTWTPSRFTVPSRKASAVSCARPSSPGGSDVAPASITASTVTTGDRKGVVEGKSGDDGGGGGGVEC